MNSWLQVLISLKNMSIEKTCVSHGALLLVLALGIAGCVGENKKIFQLCVLNCK